MPWNMSFFRAFFLSVFCYFLFVFFFFKGQCHQFRTGESGMVVVYARVRAFGDRNNLLKASL